MITHHYHHRLLAWLEWSLLVLSREYHYLLNLWNSLNVSLSTNTSYTVVVLFIPIPPL